MAIVATPTLPKPWWPSFHNWEPVLDSAGNQKLGLRKLQGSDEIFGLANSKLSNEKLIAELRTTFRAVVVAQIVIPFLRIPVRVVSLMAGDFKDPGLRKAENAWQLRCQKASKSHEAIPSEYIHTALKVFYVAREGLKHVAKLALYVAVVVPLWGIAVYGALLNPFDAGYWFGKVEGWTARDYMPVIRHCGRVSCEEVFKKTAEELKMPVNEYREAVCTLWTIITDYLMMCSQGEKTAYSSDFFRIDGGEQFEKALDGKLLVLHEMLTEKREFFENERIDVSEILSSLHMCRLHERSLDLTEEDRLPVLGNLSKMKMHLQTIQGLRQQSNEARIREIVLEIHALSRSLPRFLQEHRQIRCLAVHFLISEMARRNEQNKASFDDLIVLERNLSQYRVPKRLDEEDLLFDLSRFPIHRSIRIQDFLARANLPENKLDQKQLRALFNLIRNEMRQVLRSDDSETLGNQLQAQAIVLYQKIQAHDWPRKRSIFRRFAIEKILSLNSIHNELREAFRKELDQLEGAAGKTDEKNYCKTHPAFLQKALEDSLKDLTNENTAQNRLLLEKVIQDLADKTSIGFYS